MSKLDMHESEDIIGTLSNTDATEKTNESTIIDENELAIVIPTADSSQSPSDQQKENDSYLSRKQVIIVFASLCSAVFTATLDQTIVSVTLPTIAREFNSVSLLPWIGTSYLLTSTSFLPIYGSLSDIFGRRSILIFNIAIFTIGSLLCGAATNIIFLIIARGVAGVGSAGIIALVQIVVSDIVPIHERGKYQGVFGSVYSVSSVVGPLLGGVFTDKLSWRWAFYINIPFGIIAIITSALYLKLRPVQGSWRDKIGKIDFLGGFLIIAFVVILLLALQWGGSTYAWNSPIIIALLCVSVVLLALAVYVEMKIAQIPIIPSRLFAFRNPTFAFSLNIFLRICYFGELYYLPIYFQTVWNESATIAGLELLPFAIGLVLSSMAAGQISSRFGVYRPQIWIGQAMMTVACVLISFLKINSTHVETIFYLLLFGVGLGLSSPQILISCQAAVPRSDLATVTSTLSFARSLGGVFGVSIAGSIFNNKFNEEISSVLAQLTPEQMQQYTINGSNFFRQLGGPLLDQFLQAYMQSLQRVFTAMIPFVAIAFVLSLFIEHKSLKKKEAKK